MESPLLPFFPTAACCALAAASAIAVVLLRRPVMVALALLAHSLSLAALYMTLSATFSAVAQTLIYSGAVVVLFLIVVALLPSGGAERLRPSGFVAAGFVAATLGAGLAAAIAATRLPAVNREIPSVKEVGAPFFAGLVVPFELTAPLLLCAIIAAITLWRRHESADKKGALG